MEGAFDSDARMKVVGMRAALLQAPQNLMGKMYADQKMTLVGFKDDVERAASVAGSATVHEAEEVKDGSTVASMTLKREWPARLAHVLREPVSNASDAAGSSKFTVRNIHVVVDDEGVITVFNDGSYIPIEEYTDATAEGTSEMDAAYIRICVGKLIPEVAFSVLHTSNKFERDASHNKNAVGQNGIGAKGTNVLSDFFQVCINERGKRACFMEWVDNMSRMSQNVVTTKGRGEAVTTPAWPSEVIAPALVESTIIQKNKSFVMLRFKPSYAAHLGVKEFNPLVKLYLTNIVWDLAMAVPKKIRICVNGKEVPHRSPEERMQSLLAPLRRATPGIKLTVAKETIKSGPEAYMPYMTLCVAAADPESGVDPSVTALVNGQTCNAGTHIKNVVCNGIKQAFPVNKEGKVTATTSQILDNVVVVASFFVEKPTYDDQAKTILSLRPSAYGWSWEPSASFLRAVTRSGLTETIGAMTAARLSKQAALKLKAAKENATEVVEDARTGARKRRVTVEKYVPARYAGVNPGDARFSSLDCTLLITEGDSAMDLARAGVNAAEHPELFGLFPIRGVTKNIVDLSTRDILEGRHSDARNIMHILGVVPDMEYSEAQLRKTINYGHVLVMSDQDHDGYHIQALLMGAIRRMCPNLIQMMDRISPLGSFIGRFNTPIVKCTLVKKRGNAHLPETRVFMTQAAYAKWTKESPEEAALYRAKYYKGLATSTQRDGKQYFRELDKMRTLIRHTGPEADATLNMVLAEDCAPFRKDMMCVISRSAPKETLEGDAVKTDMDFSGFMLNVVEEHGIPDLNRHINGPDGLTRAQRQVLWGAYITGMHRLSEDGERVSVVASDIAKAIHYHHGAASLEVVVSKMAQDHAGNYAILDGIGQFGSIRQPRSVLPASRYIFTRLWENIAVHIYQLKNDAPVLGRVRVDGDVGEPLMTVPVIPGIANSHNAVSVGWMSEIPAMSPEDLFRVTRKLVTLLREAEKTCAMKTSIGDGDVEVVRRVVLDEEDVVRISDEDYVADIEGAIQKYHVSAPKKTRHPNTAEYVPDMEDKLRTALDRNYRHVNRQEDELGEMMHFGTETVSALLAESGEELEAWRREANSLMPFWDHFVGGMMPEHNADGTLSGVTMVARYELDTSDEATHNIVRIRVTRLPPGMWVEPWIEKCVRKFLDMGSQTRNAVVEEIYAKNKKKSRAGKKKRKGGDDVSEDGYSEDGKEDGKKAKIKSSMEYRVAMNQYFIQEIENRTDPVNMDVVLHCYADRLRAIIGGATPGLPPPIHSGSLDDRFFTPANVAKHALNTNLWNHLRELRQKAEAGTLPNRYPDLEKMLRLTGKVSLSNMNMFNSVYELSKFRTFSDFFIQHAFMRVSMNRRRLVREMKRLATLVTRKSEQYRFVKMVVDGDIVVGRTKKAELNAVLAHNHFLTDQEVTLVEEEDDHAGRREGDDVEESDDDKRTWKYLVNMPIFNLTQEELERLEREKDKASAELEEVKHTSCLDLWAKNLEEGATALEEYMNVKVIKMFGGEAGGTKTRKPSAVVGGKRKRATTKGTKRTKR